MEKTITLLYFDLTQYNKDKIQTTITIGDFVNTELVQKLIDQLVLVQKPGSFAAVTPFESSSLVRTALPEIENLNYDAFFEHLKAKINDDQSIIDNRNLKSNPISKQQLKSLSTKDLKIYWRIIAIYDNLRKFLRGYIMALDCVAAQNNLPHMDSADRPEAKLLNLDLKQQNPIAHYFFLAQIFSIYYNRFRAKDDDISDDISPDVYYYLQMKFQIDKPFLLNDFHFLINLAHRLQSSAWDERQFAQHQLAYLANHFKSIPPNKHLDFLKGDFSIFFQSTLFIANEYIRFQPDASLKNYVDQLMVIMSPKVQQSNLEGQVGEEETSQNRKQDYYKPLFQITQNSIPFINLINLLMQSLVEFYGSENLAAQAILPFTVNCTNWTLARPLSNILFFIHIDKLFNHTLASLPIADNIDRIKKLILNELKLQLKIDDKELAKIVGLCFSNYPDDDWSNLIYRNAILLKINEYPKKRTSTLPHQLLTQDIVSPHNAEPQFGINPGDITIPTLTPKTPNTTSHPHKKSQPIQNLLSRLSSPLLFMTYLSLCLFLNHCLTPSLNPSILIPRSDL